MMVETTRDLLPVEVLHECFKADFAVGRLRWKRRPRDHFATERGWKIFTAKYAGKDAIATPTDYGCESALTLCGVRHRLNRAHVLWAMRFGAWSKHELGHRNDNTIDDRIDNLREQNAQQRTAFTRKSNALGVRGVFRDGNKFRAAISINRRQQSLGTFETIEEAASAYEAAARRQHGEFARTAPVSGAAS